MRKASEGYAPLMVKIQDSISQTQIDGAWSKAYGTKMENVKSPVGDDSELVVA
ncbi:hypothetical protein HWD32_gp50 [Gordonia phage Secretariat]|uniref:Uncharacterized protein n=1 Tax=Gordonia phage Secretariat TaxID=2725616 RepID=A0A6M3SV91_9CAUD|nr:hypothetical protein HWD32_gp50 [Gordonia phage Secretariat]QJD49627.1 hypothetical protein SEA_SECRETARIAT_50 [Gordonia phage Secretariat]